MKKYINQLSVILFTVILASCNWNPTDVGNDRGHDGGDKDTIVDFDSTDKKAMIFEMKIGETFLIDGSNIIHLVSSASPDDSGGIYTVVLNLSKDKGVTYTEIILTSANSTYADKKISISILVTSPRVGATIRTLI